MLRHFVATLVLCMTFSCTTATLAQLADSAWPDYGGGYANQHRSPNRGPSTTPTISWSFDLSTVRSHAGASSQPILLPDGSLVFSAGNQNSESEIVALTPDGSLRWHRYYYDTGLGPWLAADQQNHIYTIYGDAHSSYGDYTEYLGAIDFQGKSLWTKGLAAGFRNAQDGPTVGRDGIVYASADHSPLHGITPNGSVSFISAATSGYHVNPAVATDGTIYVGGNSLTALNPDGTVKWSYASGSFLSPAIGDDGTIFAGRVNSSMLVALRPDGSVLWSRSDLNGAPAIGTNGDVYVVPKSGILHALNPNDGSTRWTYATGSTGYYDDEGVTVDVDGNLYLCAVDGILKSLTRNGELRWSLDLAPNDSGLIGPSAPIIGNDGTLYICGGSTGLVFAVAPEPSTLVLLGVGFICTLARALRRRSRLAGGPG